MIKQPLQNKTIVITRTEEKSKQFANQIVGLGGNPIIIPLIAVQPALLSFEEEQIFHQLDQFDWLIFTSVNGVECFLSIAKNLNIDYKNQLPKIAVVGEKTKQLVEEKGMSTALLPDEFVAESLIKVFRNEILENKRILYIKGNLARGILTTELQALGASITELTVYETVCPAKRQDLLALLNMDIAAITFTSPSTIKHFVQLLHGTDWQSWLQRTAVCCIGPITEKTARAYQIIPAVVPKKYTMEGLLEELVVFFQEKEENI